MPRKTKISSDTVTDADISPPPPITDPAPFVPIHPRENVLYYGDCLDILTRDIRPESVDLIYLDPPFNSNRNFSVIFKDKPGTDSEAQQEAFSDTWRWTEQSKLAFDDLLRTCHNARLAETMQAMWLILGPSSLMTYLTSMAARLLQMHRVLKPTGSLWLHCDTTASHYLKMILDAIFGPENFQNEVIWKRTSSHNDAKKRMGDLTDILLYYSRSSIYTFNVQHAPYDEEYAEAFYRYQDKDGRRYTTGDTASPNPRPNLMYDWQGFEPPKKGWRYSRETMDRLYQEGRIIFSETMRPRTKRYLDEMPGTPIGNVWDDIKPVQSQSNERLGYPTQKPLALLERIIAMSTNEGDLVLDPYCGCGTAVVAAHTLNRKWIGIDISQVATTIIQTRLEQNFDDLTKTGIRVYGTPNDEESLNHLADTDRYGFQNWACSLVNAYPLTKKGADGGIDGFMNFSDYEDKLHKALVQVKAGRNISVKDIREFRAVLEREKATLGFFLCRADIKETMRQEALEFGFWESYGTSYPRLQILSVYDLMQGRSVPRLPVQEKRSILQYKAAKKQRRGTQRELEL